MRVTWIALKFVFNVSLLPCAGIILILMSVLTSFELRSSVQKSSEAGILMGLTSDGLIFHNRSLSQFPWALMSVLDCWNFHACSWCLDIIQSIIRCPSSNLSKVSYNRNDSVHHRHTSRPGVQKPAPTPPLSTSSLLHLGVVVFTEFN